MRHIGVAIAGLTCCLVGLSGQHAAAIETGDFFRPSKMAGLRVSPRGDFFAVVSRVEETRHLVVFHRETQAFESALTFEPGGGQWFAWADDDTLLTRSGRQALLISVSWTDKRGLRLRQTPIGVGGQVYAFPGRANEILYGFGNRIHRLAISDLTSRLGIGRPKKESVVASHEEDVLDWVVDRKGEPRAVLTEIEEPARTKRLWYRKARGDDWILVSEWEVTPDEDFFRPLGFTPDGQRLLVYTDRGRDTRALFEMELERGELVKVVYEHPSAQMTNLVWDYAHERLLGVGVADEGATSYHYFEGAYARHHEELRAALPDRRIEVLNASRDDQVLALRAFSPKHPGAYYVFDVERRAALELGKAAPWLADVPLAEVIRFETQAAGGGPLVESFLVRAKGLGALEELDPAPLVVMPHGGPIGIRDDLGFDPTAQLLAHHGYNVLKVNYRGSSGFGKAFKNAGKGEWGAGIEDDIDAAIAYVIEQGWVDPMRIAFFGASYGGYSSLMSVIRHPKRFRCAATLMGVTDIPLMFSSSDWATTELGRQGMAAIVGDPEADFQQLMQRSPVYRAGEIEVPIFIVHGAKDERVDVDHAYRLRIMLEKHGNPPRMLVLKEHGHYRGDEKTEARIHDALLRFLAKHLRPTKRAAKRTRRRVAPHAAGLREPLGRSVADGESGGPASSPSSPTANPPARISGRGV